MVKGWNRHGHAAPTLPSPRSVVGERSMRLGAPGTKMPDGHCPEVTPVVPLRSGKWAEKPQASGARKPHGSPLGDLLSVKAES
jgi:hypothetical protein